MPPANTTSMNSTPQVGQKKSPVKAIVVLLVIGLVVYLILNSFVFKKKTMQTNTTNNQPASGGSAEELGYNPEESTTVTLTEDGFSPQTVTIKTGQSITWVNNSGETATVDSSPHPVHTDFPFMNLGEFEDGESKVLVFPEAGTFKYHDHLNSSHFGTVVVQ